MRITRLYIPDTIAKDSRPVITLNVDDSRYLTKVMRYTEGDQVELFNGDGNNYSASIVSAGKSTKVQINDGALNITESPVAVTLVQSLAKGSKLDLVIQKATELGVHRITPVSSERSVLQVDEKRANKKAEHWIRIARSACAQCNRSVVPVIDPVIELNKWLTDNADQQSILIHPAARHTFKGLAPSHALNIIVGPEGGFSDSELQFAKDTGVSLVQCGPRVLRTETAGLAALAIVQSHIGDMS